MVKLVADEMEEESFFLPFSFPSDLPNVSLSCWNLERTKLFCSFFFSLCNILQSWKILWNSSVYRVQVKTLSKVYLFIYLLPYKNALLCNHS